MSKNDDIYEIISMNIKKYRKEIKITQRELAELTDYSDEFIRRIESKKAKKNFSIATIYHISLALGIPVGLLFIKDKESVYSDK